MQGQLDRTGQKGELCLAGPGRSWGRPWRKEQRQRGAGPGQGGSYTDLPGLGQGPQSMKVQPQTLSSSSLGRGGVEPLQPCQNAQQLASKGHLPDTREETQWSWPSGPGLVFPKSCLSSTNPGNTVKACEADQAGDFEHHGKIGPSPSLVKFRPQE